MYSVLYIKWSVHNVQCTVYQVIMYSVLYIKWSVHNVQCTVYQVECT